MPGKIGVLVTRPSTLAAPLIAQLENQGFKVWHLPTTQIELISDSPTVKQAISQLLQHTWHIFVSRHAVQSVMPQIVKTWSMLDLASIRFAAVGPSTAAELTRFINFDVIYPQDNLGGAALLEVLDNQIQPTQSVCIWCGNHLTQALPKGLQARGIKVQTVECYESKKVAAQDFTLPRKINYIMITSGEGLKQLMHACALTQLNQTILIVASERLKQLAYTLGFTGKIILAQGADDSSMINAIKGLAK
jgi:uroporphyrinogen-III synthase